MRIPNCFIVGAPKCGTTAMYEFLSQHPDVFMSPIKEPYFFGKDLTNRMRRLTSDEYLALFDGAHKEKVVGEASITYLFSSTAAREIHTFNSESRIVIMLRDPVAMMYSLHSQLLFTRVENIRDFESALAAEPERRKGQRIPPDATIVDFLFYRRFADYVPQVRRYLDIFGRDAVHVILFDEFKADPEGAYHRTLQFLGLDVKFRPPSFWIVNANRILRNDWLRRFLNRPAVKQAVRAAIPNYPLRQQLAKRFSSGLIIKERRRVAMDPQLEKHLRRELRPQIDDLSRLLRVNLPQEWAG